MGGLAARYGMSSPEGAWRLTRPISGSRRPGSHYWTGALGVASVVSRCTGLRFGPLNVVGADAERFGDLAAGAWVRAVVPRLNLCNGGRRDTSGLSEFSLTEVAATPALLYGRHQR